MAASHAAVLAIMMLALSGAGYVLLSHDLDRAVTNQLLTAATQQVIRIEEAGHALPPPDSDAPSTSATQIGVFRQGGRPLGETPELPSWLTPGPRRVTDRTIAGEHARLVTLSASSGGTLLATVVAARSLTPEEQLLRRVRLLLLGGGAVAIALSLAAGWLLAGRAVRPVERAYEAQAGFAADASHELRTPLTFVRSGVEVLAERDPALGAQVLDEIDHLTGITKRLLALARAEGGKLRLDPQPIDVAAICRSSARRSEAASGARLVLDGDDAGALGDPVATEAALDAVLENVSVHGGGEAVVRWRTENRRVLISVADHGPGLRPEFAERAFERFARGDRSRTRATGGAGLGLALSRGLVEGQGGSMWLEETPGGGLTANIALPAP
jgi:signal transduction histidine kinase